MPRPRKCRRVQNHPRHGFYKPQGVPIQDLRGVTLPVEGLEAIRLADAEGIEHEEAARQMGVSRPTFSRILSEARRQVARALSNGWAIRIEGAITKWCPPPGHPGEIVGEAAATASDARNRTHGEHMHLSPISFKMGAGRQPTRPTKYDLMTKIILDRALMIHYHNLGISQQ
jgi:predicted DNA-binding protein (UPF0251 family)